MWQPIVGFQIFNPPKPSKEGGRMFRNVLLAALLLAPVSIEAKADSNVIEAFTNPNVYCLAETIFIETRGTTNKDKLLVGSVVMNRIDSPHFPDTACDVQHQKGQFPWVKKMSKQQIFGIIKRNQKEFMECMILAMALLDHSIKRYKKVLYFHNYTDPTEWTAGLNLMFKTKYHVYYGE